MNEKVIQFSRGNFEVSHAELKLSDTSLVFQVEEGRVYKGNFYIGNDMDVLMQGILYSDCPYLTLARENLDGRELSIEYTFDAAGLMAGETVNCNIQVITNCGEVCIPVTATIDIPTVAYEGGRIKDLTGFAALAKESPAYAVSIFKSSDFERVFLYRDIENQILYNALLKSSETICAMEEFLVATRKKNRITLSIEKNNYSYDNCFAEIRDKIVVTRSTWGSVEIVVRSDSEFIVPVHKRMWTDQFSCDSVSLEFKIIPSHMKDGINKGKIYLETIHQTIEINVTARPSRKGVNKEHANKEFSLGAMRSFVALRNGKISSDEFRERIDGLLVKNREVDRELSDMCVAYASVITSANNMDEYVAAMKQPKAPQSGDDVRVIIQYCLYMYICAMADTAKDNVSGVSDTLDKLKHVYNELFDHWLIFILILKLEGGYKENHQEFVKMVNYIKEGCYSPVVYGEFCDILKKDVSLIHEWDECMIRPLSWGVKNDILTEELAVGLAYHVSRLKEFDKNAYRALVTLYKKYANKELLHAICGMLIKGGIVSEEALVWYSKGIDEQLRITQLYEYYMMSLPDNDERIIPHQVLMYFAFDNRLSDREKTKLFASVIRGKSVDEAAYKAYSIAIPNYARIQLGNGRIDSNLAVIYEDSIKLDSIDETIACALPKVMFRKEIICNNPLIEAVCVVHKEITNEQLVPIVNGRAYIDIYSKDAFIFVVDRKGNRYYQTGDYTVRKLLHMDSYAEKCAEYSTEDDGLLLYLYSKCLKDYKNGEDIIAVRRLAHRQLKLRSYYKKNNMSALIYYYYEHADGERLDEMLDIINLGESDRNTRSKWIQLYIVRGKYLEALNAVSKYGYDGIDVEKLGKMCEELIKRDTEKLTIDGTSVEEALISASYEVFSRGGYSRDIVNYLVAGYNGTSAHMLDIWKMADGLLIDSTEYTERVLDRLLLVEANIREGIPVLESYMKSGKDDTYKKAYISYVLYMYLRNEGISNSDISDEIWAFVKSKLMYEYNTTCLLARLKSFSQAEAIEDKDRMFCEVNLSKLYKNGIVMDFYRELEQKLHTSIVTADRKIVQCIARPGIKMKLCCMLDNKTAQIIKIPEVHYGVYAIELVVFYGEHINYEFFEEKSGKKQVYSRGVIEYQANDGSTCGRLGMINGMLKSLEDRDYRSLSEKMCSYIENEQTSKNLFEIL